MRRRADKQAVSRFAAHAATALMGIVALLTFAPTPGWAYQELQQFSQPEARGADGRIKVEASIIHVVACNGPGENGGQFYVYQYLNRPGFRAILPPNWADALGGRDFATYEEAAAVACGQGIAGAGIRVLSGTYGANCGQPEGNVTAHLRSMCDGRTTCQYAVDYTVIGDPAYGCAKDYVATWSCGASTPQTARAGAEAGYGSIVELRC